MMHLPVMMLMMTVRFMTRLLLCLMTSHYSMTRLVVKVGGNSTLGLRYTGEQQPDGNEYGKFCVHDLCFLMILN
jgi:hypothetical protein